MNFDGFWRAHRQEAICALPKLPEMPKGGKKAIGPAAAQKPLVTSEMPHCRIPHDHD